MLKAVNALLADDSFTLDTEATKSSYEIAEKLSRFIIENETVVSIFEARLALVLGSCIEWRRTKQNKNREQTWSSYHKIRVEGSTREHSCIKILYNILSVYRTSPFF